MYVEVDSDSCFLRLLYLLILCDTFVFVGYFLAALPLDIIFIAMAVKNNAEIIGITIYHTDSNAIHVDVKFYRDPKLGADLA